MSVDFYDLNDLLTEEERMVRDTVRAFVDAKILPTISHHYEAGTFPTELIPEFGRLGMLGSNLHGYGCPGMGDIAYGLVAQELERGDSGIRSFCSVQSSLVMWPIYTYGTEEQKNTWLPRLATGEAVGCFGLTEPDFGSNPGGMITRAERTATGFVLNGTKRWITNGNLADVAIIWAKLDGVIRGFVVDTKTPGFTAQKIERKFSLRASVTSELILEDVHVPESAMFPDVKGLKGPLGCLTQARYGISWGAIGAAEACFDCAVDYAKNRVQFSRPIAGYQLVQAKFADMLTEITKAKLISWRLGKLKEAKKMTPGQVSLAKRNNVHMALETARKCRDILGGNGITYEYPIARHLMNLETVITYEGTHDIHTLVLGQEVTGIPAYDAGPVPTRG
ncbi:MAG: acyl-CoA dehydrogenase family protein [Deltaproteobacteria bacterium]|nr:acyl-CoA dehydrogenase family protein [Deltaproteobacteria bacterium]